MASKRVFISFDIDGTIIEFDKNVSFHHEAFAQAVTEYFGKADIPAKMLGYSVAGWMDRKILKNMIEKLGYEASNENLEKTINKATEIFSNLFTATPIVPIGMREMLEELSTMPNVTIGLATGNLEGIAWKKLEAAGILKYFKGRFGGFGDVVLDRADAIRTAKLNAEKALGIKFDKAIHIGDMISDAQGAIDAGAHGIIVKTGAIVLPDDEYPKPCTVLENMKVNHDDFLNIVNNN